MLAWSLLAAPPVAALIFASFQTANLTLKWPATQLIGWTTVLMNVVIFCAPLHWFFSPLVVAVIATVAWLLISCFAVYSAHKIHNTCIKLSSPKITKPYKLLHLSDIHAGSRSKSFVDKVVKQANEQQADVALITGDLLDSCDVDTAFLQPLGKLTCPVYLCLGNHERYVNLEKAIDAITTNKVQILRSTTARFDEIEFTGIDDADGPDQVATELPDIVRQYDHFQVLLYHRPTGFEFAAAAGIELMLCGHTHAGQVWPFGILVKRQFPRMKGLHTLDNATLYVSQGTGTWGPIMRLGTRSEMTLIELEPDT